MEYLPEIVKKIGGWHLNGEFNESIDFNERVQLLQNHFAVDIFFKWGVQERGGRKYLSIVPLQKKVFNISYLIALDLDTFPSLKTNLECQFRCALCVNAHVKWVATYALIKIFHPTKGQ